ncbi:MAG: sensor histidine kinase [Firmicutes bacterium]|nr:sensor histidine kinase [Bacillota bacterium]
MEVGRPGSAPKPAGFPALTANAMKLTPLVQFMLLCLVLLCLVAFTVGSFLGWAVERGVTARIAAITALYVDSFISDYVQSLAANSSLTREERSRLDQLLEDTALGRKIVAFKVWTADYRVAYSTDSRLQGLRFPPSPGLTIALGGGVRSSISSLDQPENLFETTRWRRLVETYAPIRQSGTGRVIGAVEFYQTPEDLEVEVARLKARGWLIVALSAVTVYLILVGFVRRASNTIVSLSQRLRRVAAQKAETDEQVLLRLSQDLHDGPAQDLGLALLRLGNLEKQALGQIGQENAVRGAARTFGEVREAVDRALSEIRHLCAGLRLPELERLSLEEVFQKLKREHEARTGSRLHVSTDNLPQGVSLATRIALYRVAQESLNNACRHGRSSSQWLALTGEDGLLELTVRDDGVGFQPSHQTSPDQPVTGLGLRGMNERVLLLGGTFSVLSMPGRGTVVRVSLPVEP